MLHFRDKAATFHAGEGELYDYSSLVRYYEGEDATWVCPKVSMEEGIDRTVQWYQSVGKEEKKGAEAFRKTIWCLCNARRGASKIDVMCRYNEIRLRFI